MLNLRDILYRQFSIKGVCSIALVLILFSACSDDDYYAPKPKGYYRISFPEKTYQKFDSDCPFTFDHPTYSKVFRDRRNVAEPCWMNLEFPKFNATLHISYKELKGDFLKYLEDSRTLAVKHQVKASGMEELPVIKDSSNVFGLIYRIEGNTASSLQFHLTDSTNHFLRASLYFNCKPNKDSLAPVLEYITEDVNRFIENFEWK